ncbi:MAG: hypothetical protein AAF364_18440, partial [Pseudomonadota bacterium]
QLLIVIEVTKLRPGHDGHFIASIQRVVVSAVEVLDAIPPTILPPIRPKPIKPMVGLDMTVS